MRELSTQAASDIYTSAERSKISTEMDQLKAQITDISENTKFNGKKVFEGTKLNIQVGANAGENLELEFKNIDLKTLGIEDLKVGDNAEASDTINALDKALEKITTERSTLGSQINRIEYTISNLNTSIENLSAAESRISDVDMAQEVMNLTRQNILSNAANSMLAQSMQAPQSVLQLLG